MRRSWRFLPSINSNPTSNPARSGEIRWAARAAVSVAATPRRQEGEFVASTLHRLEQCQQSITLGRLQQIMQRLKCGLPDIFP